MKKRILLLGEYSGFLTNLKNGFEALGHKVVFYHDGDGGKKIGGDYQKFNLKPKSFFSNLTYLKQLSKSLKDFDLVIFVNPDILGPYYSNFFFKKIRKYNKKIIVSSCGDSTYLLKAVKKKRFKYYMFDDDKNGMFVKIKTIYEKRFIRHWMHFVDWYAFSKCDYIVPTSYEYSMPLEKFKNLSSVIGLPIEIPNKKPDFSISNKIKIFYGKNKPFFKGASYIIPALQKLGKDFPDSVEITISERMPYEEYKKRIDEADIIVDQCKSYGWGMNALIAMSKGKIVASGCNPETLKAFGIEECPIISIEPDETQIYNALKAIVEDRSSLSQRKERSFNFVKENNSAVNIAKQYLRLCEADNEN